MPNPHGAFRAQPHSAPTSPTIPLRPIQSRPLWVARLICLQLVVSAAFERGNREDHGLAPGQLLQPESLDFEGAQFYPLLHPEQCA